jgi:hypothetical protein
MLPAFQPGLVVFSSCQLLTVGCWVLVVVVGCWLWLLGVGCGCRVLVVVVGCWLWLSGVGCGFGCRAYLCSSLLLDVG